MSAAVAILHRPGPAAAWAVVTLLPSLAEAAVWLDALGEFAPDRWAVRAGGFVVR